MATRNAMPCLGQIFVQAHLFKDGFVDHLRVKASRFIPSNICLFHTMIDLPEIELLSIMETTYLDITPSLKTRFSTTMLLKPVTFGKPVLEFEI